MKAPSSDNPIPVPKSRFAPWLFEPMFKNKAIYVKVAVAAALINVFGLISAMFTMTVYDRVVPNNAMSSLVALSIGLGIVIIFDFVLRLLRAISSTSPAPTSTATSARPSSAACSRSGSTSRRALRIADGHHARARGAARLLRVGDLTAVWSTPFISSPCSSSG
jgi:hypothetical protein